MIKKFIILALIIATPFITSAQAYKIKIDISGFAGKDIILGHYFSDRMLPDDTCRLNAKGIGYLQGNEKLAGGMYFLFLPNRNYFDILINENQFFEISNDTTDYTKNFKSKNSPENKLFYEYQLIMKQKSKEAEQLRKDKKEIAGDKVKEKEIDNKLNQLQKDVNNALQNVISNHSETFLAAFLKATKEVVLPKEIEDENKFYWYINHYFDNMPIEDERFVRTPIYEGKVKNYIKVLDQLPPDSVIKYIDILFDRSGVNNAKGNRNEELFRFMLITVHNHYAATQIMGHDAIFIHVAENYYIPKAHWADAEYITKLKDNIAKIKSNLIGNDAPSLIMQKLPSDKASIEALITKSKEVKKAGFDAHLKIIDQYSQDQKLKQDLTVPNLNESKRQRILKKSMEKENKSAQEKQIHDLVYREYVKNFESFYNEVDKYIDGYPEVRELEADNTVIWFWEPDCSHCRTETPIMGEFYKKFNQLDFASSAKNIEMYTVFLPRAIDDWGKFTHSLTGWLEFLQKNELTDWLNVWDPYGETNFRKSYNVYSTPTVYLLDTEKKIIAKRIGIDAIRRIMFDKYITEKKENLSDKELIKTVESLTELFINKNELEDLKTIIEGRFEGDVKTKALKIIEKKIKNEK